MANAPVGDDLFGEDPTVNRLEEKAAETFEKESGLYVPSGTMANQIAVKLHTKPGQEVILEARSHMFDWEMAMMAALSGCLARPVKSRNGLLEWSEIELAISPKVYFRAQTGLISLENTHNMAGGTVMTSAQTAEIVQRAHELELPVHLDGARIFNAAICLGESVADLARGCDTVMFCLSKGLSAPVGSLLLSSSELIKEARSIRKMMGGGMRQAGIIAAAGLIALEEMTKRLEEDHLNARQLAEALNELEHFSINPDSVQTNIVVCGLNQVRSDLVVEALSRNGVLAVAIGPRQIRFVTHRNVTREGTCQAIEVLRRLDQEGFAKMNQ
jgi:threonine aldolase